MRILVCAATEAEIAPTLQALSVKENKTIKFLITGVGLMACTYALTRETILDRPDIIIQAGVAGTLQLAHPLSQVVVVRSEIIGDLGVKEEGGFQSLFDLKLLSFNTLPWQTGRLINDNTLLAEAALPVVDGVTVNEITTDEATIQFYRDQLNVQVESMEGAALHYVAILEKISFLQIRSLSNYIGERDKEKWKMKEAIKNLNLELQRILAKL
jgi:futalosine hydrolase